MDSEYRHLIYFIKICLIICGFCAVGLYIMNFDKIVSKFTAFLEGLL